MYLRPTAGVAARLLPPVGRRDEKDRACGGYRAAPAEEIVGVLPECGSQMPVVLVL